MKFVSAEWITDPITGEHATIRATGDDGSIWYVPSAGSDVPPWPEFIEEYGVEAIREAQTKPGG
jgi:hypothetical protein